MQLLDKSRKYHQIDSKTIRKLTNIYVSDPDKIVKAHKKYYKEKNCINKEMIGNSMKNQQNKFMDVILSPDNKKTRRIRYSEPNLILDDPQMITKLENEDKKEQKQEPVKKLKKQPRLSQVTLANTTSSIELMHSPQNQSIPQFTRQMFYSPGCMKKPVNSKNPSSPSKQQISQNSIALQSKIKGQNKNKKSPIQNHKQTLNKIQQMLLNHGISLNGSKRQVKNEHQVYQKCQKIPVNTHHLLTLVNKEKDKKGGAELLKKKVNTQVVKRQIYAIEQTQEDRTQLKDTVSTHSSCKKKSQLKISQFTFGKQLGKGKFGVVKVAVHKKTGLIFSLKIIKKSVIQKQSIIEQLIRQVKIQSFMNSPHIVRLYDIFDDSQNIYLLMELCCSGNLYQYMRSKVKIQESEARSLIRSICQGVAQLHRHNIIHRDFKPENIVLCYGMTKICDFGWSAQYKDVMRETFCGTPLYVSPELLSGNRYDEKVDLWAIGILAYQMMTGKIPFDIRSQKQLTKIIYAKIVYPSSMSEEAVSFLECLLARDPLSRKSIREVLAHPFLQRRPEKQQ